MINLTKDKFIISCDEISDCLYLVNNELGKIIKLKYYKNEYSIDLDILHSEIFEEIYFNNKKIKFNVVSNIEEMKALNLTNLLQTKESIDSKYVYILFNDSEGKSNLTIDFTELYKNKMRSSSYNISGILKEINTLATEVRLDDEGYKIKLINEYKNGEKVNIQELLTQGIEDSIPYKSEILYEKRGIEKSFRDEVKFITNELDYTCNLEEIYTIEKNECIYDLYLIISTYGNEEKIRIITPYMDKTTINSSSKLILVKNSNLISSLYYNEDSGMSFKFEILNIKVDVVDLLIEKHSIVFVTKILSNIDIENQIIQKADIYIVKRNSSLCIKSNDCIIKEKDILFKMKNDEILNKISLGIWDVYVNLTINSIDKYIRLNNYSEVKDKKNVLTFEPIISPKLNKIIKPYYTLDDGLSFEVDTEVKVSKVDYFKFIDESLEIKGEITTVQDIDISSLNKSVELLMISQNLEEKVFLSDCKIEKIGYCKHRFIIRTNKIDNSLNEEFKNKIYKNKFYLNINVKNLIYNIPVNVDYSKIVIEKIDLKLQDNKYKLKTKLLYKIMCKVLPIKKGLVVFQSFGGRSYSGNPKYIYEYAKDNYNRYKYVWALRNQFEDIPKPAKKVKIESLKYYYYLSRAEYVISNLNMQNNIKKRKKAKFIQTWHGTPLKKISFDVPKKSPSYDAKFLRGFAKRVKKWDYLLAQNNYSKNIFKRAFRYNGPIYEVGHPINDILVNNDPNKINSIKQNIGIDKEKKVILYAPTWRDSSKYALDLDIDELFKKLNKDYVLLIKSHYFVNTSFDVQKHKGFVYDVSKYEDIQELALISDILITDYSSVMFDFAATMKPIIFYCHDINYYKSRLRGFYFDFENEAPGPIVKTSEEVANAIEDIKQISLEYSKKYINFYNKFAYLEDGNSSKRSCISIFNSSYKKKKKIYFLSFNIFGMGGTGRTVINTAKFLVENGYEVEIISVFGDENDKYFEIDESIKISVLVADKKKKTRVQRVLNSLPSYFIDKDDEFYNNFSLLTDVKIILKLLKTKKSIVVSTRPGFNIMIAKFFKFRRFKVVGQEHLNFDIHTKNLQYKIRKYYPNLDMLMTLTDADTNGYKKEIPKMKNKIIRVPNAVPKLETYNSVKKNKQIIAAGRLVPQKGFDLLIKAVPKVFEKHPDWVLKIYGKGRDEKYLQDLIRKNKLQKNVLLMGPSKKIEKEMLESEIYVLSSRYEGFGMVIVEAMEMGLPVISFDCPEGPKEIITNEQDGILVNNGDLDALADQIIRLIEDEDLREKLSISGKISVKKFHSVNVGSIWIESLNKL